MMRTRSGKPFSSRIAIAASAALMLALGPAGVAHAQSASALSPEVKKYVRVSAPIVALEHVRVIDGTGAAAVDDETVVISDGKIQSVSPASAANVPSGAQVLDLSGYTVIPGLVGMHDHLFYPSGRVPVYNEMAYSFPKLYLAAASPRSALRAASSLTPTWN